VHGRHPGGRSSEGALAVLPVEVGVVGLVVLPHPGGGQQRQHPRPVRLHPGAELEVRCGRHGGSEGSRDELALQRAHLLRWRASNGGDRGAVFRRTVLGAVKLTAAAADLVLPNPPGIVVLVYHRVGGGSTSEVGLARGAFAAQMAELAASGRTLTLDDAVALLAAGEDHPNGPDPVVVTFDDGTADFVDEAVPVLAQHGVPSPLSLATAFADARLPFAGEVPAVTWAGLADAVTTGLVTVGSHTHRHAVMGELGRAAGAEERARR